MWWSQSKTGGGAGGFPSLVSFSWPELDEGFSSGNPSRPFEPLSSLSSGRLCLSSAAEDRHSILPPTKNRQTLMGIAAAMFSVNSSALLTGIGAPSNQSGV